MEEVKKKGLIPFFVSQLMLSKLLIIKMSFQSVLQHWVQLHAVLAIHSLRLAQFVRPSFQEVFIFYTFLLKVSQKMYTYTSTLHMLELCSAARSLGHS